MSRKGHSYRPTDEIRAHTPSQEMAAATRPIDDLQDDLSVDLAIDTFVDSIPARDGYAQKWVRVRLPDGTDDYRNLQKMHRLGWRPRPIDTVPTGFSTPYNKNNHLGEVVGVGDLVLFEMPASRHRQIQNAYLGKVDEQMRAVDATQDSDVRRNLQQDDRRTTVSSREPSFASD